MQARRIKPTYATKCSVITFNAIGRTQTNKYHRLSDLYVTPTSTTPDRCYRILDSHCRILMSNLWWGDNLVIVAISLFSCLVWIHSRIDSVVKIIHIRKRIYIYPKSKSDSPMRRRKTECIMHALGIIIKMKYRISRINRRWSTTSVWPCNSRVVDLQSFAISFMTNTTTTY